MKRRSKKKKKGRKKTEEREVAWPPDLLSKQNMKWEIIHIPGKLPHSLEQSTVDVLASTIEPKLANILVRKLNQICPLEDVRHVKRVRRRSVEGNIELSVILCLSSGHDDPMEDLSEDLLQLINVHQLKPFKTKIAKFAAMSKEEWEEQCTLWPTSYHPPLNLNGVVGFSDDDSQLIFNYMSVAIQLAKLSCRIGKVVNAAVIVDPLSGQIIATASDETYQWASSVRSMKSECANCNGLSSTSCSSQSNANGLVGPSKDSAVNLSSNECSESYTEVSCLHPWGWTAPRPHYDNTFGKCSSNNLWHPLRHAALVAIEKAAARDRQLFPSSGSLKEPSHTRDSLQNPSNGFPAKRQKTDATEDDDMLFNSEHDGLSSKSSSESLRPYLCTGFDMYLVWEPCTMCAMGLVHQRIRRVFYAFPNPNAGALGSVYRLHGEKSLNHHYSVFRILLPEKTLREGELNGLDS